MDLDLKLHRKDNNGGALVNRLAIADKEFCWMLENGDLKIPPGKYEIDLTWSNRIKRFYPVLLDVPGREGIRIHPANFATELLGCLAPGYSTNGESVSESRKAFNDLTDIIFHNMRDGNHVFIEVTE